MSLNDDFLFRATCQKCGMFVDSSYCNEVKGKGYSCIRCGAVCLYDRGVGCDRKHQQLLDYRRLGWDGRCARSTA